VSASSYFQALSQEGRKDYEELKADWDRQSKPRNPIAMKMKLDEGGYPLYSGNPNRLWFRSRGNWMDDPRIGDRIDGHGLLGKSEEEFAPAF